MDSWNLQILILEEGELKDRNPEVFQSLQQQGENHFHDDVLKDVAQTFLTNTQRGDRDSNGGDKREEGTQGGSHNNRDKENNQQNDGYLGGEVEEDRTVPVRDTPFK